ncbi:uridine kinase [Methylorubrum rhodesianum]|uniref:uridine kinase n=1 Tax=Methylorubrum TaxID=2282523 RepID=UPI0003453FCD|nr:MULTISPECIES: uridine kinase [Methylorubrum]MBB5762683.1 uridine kinase [Methylorubrum rhodesianum]MBI1688484.1 uridine kinase [Methylorubrum sp. DB1722]
MSEPFVLAICGPPGSGKSTLSHALSERFGGAPVLAYDAYEEITGWPPERVAAWLASGAPLNAVPVPGLTEDLAQLRRGEPVPDRERGGTLRLSRRVARPVIVLDTLLGRAHPGTGAQIDHLVWLDLPLDVALARKLRSFTGEGQRDPSAASRLLAGLDAYLGRYDTLLHPTYALQRERVRPAADQILSAGTLAEHLDAIQSEIQSTLTPVPTPTA